MLNDWVGLDEILYKRTLDLPRRAGLITHTWITVVHHCHHALFNTHCLLMTHSYHLDLEAIHPRGIHALSYTSSSHRTYNVLIHLTELLLFDDA